MDEVGALEERTTPAKISISVTNYSVVMYSGRSDQAGNYAGADLGYVILRGAGGVPGLEFHVHFVPDGISLASASYDGATKVVEMYMNWSQFVPLQSLLRSGTGVTASFDNTVGPTYEAIEGSFSVPILQELTA